MESRNEYFNRLRSMHRYLSWHDGVMQLQRSAWLAALAVVVSLLIVRLFPIEGGNRWAILPVVIWLLGTVFLALIRPLSLVQTAVRIDQRLGLKECLSSSLMLATGNGGSDGTVRYHGLFVEQLHRNANAAVREIDINHAFPLRIHKKHMALAVAMMLVCVVLLVLPNPMDAIIAERKALREEAQRQAEKIEALKKEIEETEEISEEEKEELIQELSQLAEKLRANKGDRQEALADIANLEKKLGERLDAGDSLQQSALESLSARMQELDVMDETEANNEEAIEDALAELAQLAASTDQDKREAAAQAMAAMSAKASQAGSNELAQELAAMADALRQGDSQAAAKAAASASKAVSQMRSDHALQAAVSSSLSQCQTSRQAMSNAGIKSANINQSGSGSNPQGQMGGGGGGTKADTLPPATSGNMRVQSPRGIRSADEADIIGQQIYAPREQGDTSGEELQIQGQDSGMGQEEVSDVPNPLPGSNNPVLVPYREVYGQYLDAANEAMDESYIPADLKEYVRSYFSLLEP